MFDASKVGVKWTMVIPSTIDADFFYTAAPEGYCSSSLSEIQFAVKYMNALF